MNMLTGCDVVDGKSDDLPVAAHRFTACDSPGGQLVPGRNRIGAHQIFVGQACAGRERAGGDHHIVARMKTQHRFADQ